MKKIIGLKPATIIEIISALFILLFLYTAIKKTMVIGSTVWVLKESMFLSKFAEEVAWTIVGLEYVISVLLFLPRTRKIGLYGSLGLMTAFTTYITFMMIFSPDLPCSCGGVISKMSWTQHLIFNIIFILLALIALKFTRNLNKLESENSQSSQVVFT